MDRVFSKRQSGSKYTASRTPRQPEGIRFGQAAKAHAQPDEPARARLKNPWTESGEDGVLTTPAIVAPTRGLVGDVECTGMRRKTK